MEMNALPPSGRLSAWRRAIIGLPIFAALAAGGPADGRAFDGTGETYVGVFAGLGRVDGRVVDTDGFRERETRAEGAIEGGASNG